MPSDVDLILHNAHLFDLDATALAVCGQTIAAIGSDDDILALGSADTRIIDAAGGHLMPGFVESHLHLFLGGAALGQLDLLKVFGADALKSALSDYSAQNPDEALLICFGANYTMMGDDTRLTRHHLDAALPGRPVVMVAVDFHTAWANTTALERAGLMQGRDVGPSAEVVTGPDGQATGELREQGAMDLVMALRSTGGREGLGLAGQEPGSVTQAQREDDIAIMTRGLEYCASHGITTIANMDGNRYQLELLSEMERRGALPCRIEVPYRIPVEITGDPIAKAVELTTEFQTDKISCGRVKMFMDGVYDSWTAVVVGEYPDKPGFAGDPIISQDVFDDLCVRADAEGLQISVHAVGDGAVRMVLNGYEAAARANGPRDSRHRIEHIDVIDPTDLPRLAELGVIASMQPVHPPGSAGLPLEPTTSIIGRAKWPMAWNWRMIVDSGAVMAFGTDWPVSPLDPLFAIQCAMIRKPWEVGLPDPRLSLHECFRAYTMGGAYACFEDQRLGSLVPGMKADLVLLQGDMNSLCTDGDLDIAAVLTVCDGQITYERR
ncbi:MAG: amidohydrolase [Roseovarius sp.]